MGEMLKIREKREVWESLLDPDGILCIELVNVMRTAFLKKNFPDMLQYPHGSKRTVQFAVQ